MVTGEPPLVNQEERVHFDTWVQRSFAIPLGTHRARVGLPGGTMTRLYCCDANLTIAA